ncbi:MAG: class I SAM-dependent methyltransferase [Polyangiaceae bacterium]
MREPHLSEFKELVRRGAGTLDIHDASSDSSYTVSIEAYDALVQREVGRVDLHLRSLVPLLEAHVGHAARILDVGCSTGGTAVAMALSDKLAAEHIIGVDPNEASLEAARVRARMHEVDDRVAFETTRAGAPLPFDDGAFDLVICVSVLEYVHRLDDRRALVDEMKRVTRPGGHILLITPSPFRLRDYHTKRVLGDLRRRDGYPWSSTPGQLASMLSGCEITWMRAWQLGHGLRKLGVPIDEVPERFGFLGMALPWQKVLARKPS